MSEKKQWKPNPKQKKFCELYATNQEFFGNGVQSYVEAYDVDVTQKGKYAAARASVSKLLTNCNILAYIDEIMVELGNTTAHADKQLQFIMTQNAELGPKLGAIRHFNDLRQRITQKIELSGKVTLEPPIVE